VLEIFLKHCISSISGVVALFSSSYSANPIASIKTNAPSPAAKRVGRATPADGRLSPPGVGELAALDPVVGVDVGPFVFPGVGVFVGVFVGVSPPPRGTSVGVGVAVLFVVGVAVGVPVRVGVGVCVAVMLLLGFVVGVGVPVLDVKVKVSVLQLWGVGVGLALLASDVSGTVGVTLSSRI